jgi:hypothetical protein
MDVRNNVVVKKVRNLYIQPDLAGEHQLVLHFGVHKSMTSYFNRVYLNVCKDFFWDHQHYNSDVEGFYQKVAQSNSNSIYSVNNTVVDFDKIKQKFKGTHIVRDPRDLLVSSYRYHLWTNEQWANDIMEEPLVQRLKLEELGIDAQKTKGKTFKEFLNSLDEIEGYLVELNFREKHFDAMFDFEVHQDILELKYEEIFGNELKAFTQIFEQYGFNDKMAHHALKYVDLFSFKSLTKQQGVGGTKHASVGKTQQWKEKIPTKVIDVFHAKYAPLVNKYGYEM